MQRLEPVMPFEGDVASRAKGPEQASPASEERTPPWVLHEKRDEALKGRDNLCRPFRALFVLPTDPRAASASDADAALGWLVQGLWPGVRRLCQSA